MQLSWSPLSKTGTLTTAVDGKALLTYQVEGEEKMGTGTPGMMRQAAITLRDITLPFRTLTFSNLLPGETAVFSWPADRALAVRRQIPAHVQSKTLATSVQIDVSGGSLPNRENETEGPRLLGKTCP
jgi:hypothetical protein